TPAVSGTAIVSTCGGTTAYDSVVYVLAGGCQGAQVACNDDTAGCTTIEPNDHHGSRVAITVTAGQSYVIVVDGYRGASGNYTLTITPPAGASPTASPSTTPTPGPTGTATATRTATPTVTPTATLTATPTRTATVTPTTTVSAVPTATRTATPTATLTPIP